jgi:hypothetical protein
MANSNLTTRLAKELRRSPKKTAVLALMAVVALWFWAPLAWKWIAPQASDAAPTAALSPTTDGAVAAVTTESAPSAPAQPSFGWRELSDMLQQDPLLSSATTHDKLADPFAKPVAVEEQTNVEGETSELPDSPIAQAIPTPEQLGLILASTITGGRRAVATINGKSCRVGDVIVVPGNGLDHEFMVIAIAAGAVTLSAGDQTHVLTTKRPDSTMQLSQAGAGGAVHAVDGQRVVIGARLGE